MKKMFCFLAVMFCLTVSNANAQRVIQSVVVTFQTTNDDKDWNSFIRFQLQSADGSWMATQEGTFGTFPDNSVYSYGLNLGSYYPEYFLNNSYLYVYMNPVGNDTWNFNWSVRVTFTDGSSRTASGWGSLSESGQAFRLRVF